MNYIYISFGDVTPHYIGSQVCQHIEYRREARACDVFITTAALLGTIPLSLRICREVCGSLTVCAGDINCSM